ncbi:MULTISPECIES: pyridoxamine 5'-phosphate oxidase [unclassified Leeuwenhoekiella]|uniref:pyridoxamine 5'-phosphate oxidase n=1 Tax=unclassified Leeuwenhoekiella TaxID=2615029 RepID=UPI000C517B1D|nr:MULTISPECIES: pyridoxamine 5'-phosphate oxidase [unclassified Leeuwenhoekiella]MAW95082.1 pyridoxamine 5'-phosphate oxidase [Leeuwenhoekiella sp.]MBA79802.1 pyridoxamine 5'-phosphate oxidase [Leeuwenhoekiella sp.]|tara:strand:- start:50612 stop:51256 length:645 start_codon:yes stop_codon:yes gene_type:complete
MAEDLSDYRKSYEFSELTREQSASDPFEQFQKWFEEVEQAQGLDEVNAMTISTIGLDGFPKNRVVLLKSYDSNGFVFYTNYDSEKGRALAVNPNICLSFFWPNLERQVIIKGTASRVDEETSTKYFHSRPEGSQLGAWVSPQSAIIPNRKFLEERQEKFEEDFKNQEIPKPPHWGGYRVTPNSFEFWQGRPNRLHDRLLYSISESGWDCNRLAP